VHGELHPLPGLGEVTLHRGETVLSYTAAGGGYGDPLDREPERVLRDLAEGWITAERAHDVYGVVVDERGELDAEATRTRRAARGADSRTEDR
jgi:N-methylhydantoinase B